MEKPVQLFRNDTCRVLMRRVGLDKFEPIFEIATGKDSAGDPQYRPVKPDSVEELRLVASALAQDYLKKQQEEARRREEELYKRGGPGDR